MKISEHPDYRGKMDSAGLFEKRQQVYGEQGNEKSCVLEPHLHNDETCKENDYENDFEESPDKDDVGEENDYETLRKRRISENQAQMTSLGLQKTYSELRSIVSSSRQERTVRKWVKVDYSSAPLRRSDRLKGVPCESNFEDNEVEKKRRRYKRLANGRSAEAMARRCASKVRGGMYDGIYGIFCHSCRHQNLCWEEDCKRCGSLDMKEPCIGKTECSVCHSSNGVICRVCLKVRYGEEMDDVRENKQWMCPHCVEEKGVRPYWICNSRLCLKKRMTVPTGITIHKARELGYESVAHLLMEKLKEGEEGGGQRADCE